MHYGCSYTNFLSFNGRKDLTNLTTKCLKIDFMTIQDDWRFCRRCNGLVYGGSEVHGLKRCPAGVEPLPGSMPGSQLHDLDPDTNYALIFAPSIVGSQDGGQDHSPVLEGQDHWCYCRKCEGLAYFNPPARHPAKKCPEGGLHSFEGSGNYVLMVYTEKPHIPDI